MTLIMSEFYFIQRKCIISENRTAYIRVRFEVLAAVNMKITVFRDVTPCSLVDRYQRVVPFRWKQQVSPKILNLSGPQKLVVFFTRYGKSCEMGVSIKKVCKCVHSVLPLA
jgi:hypothetical protein